MRAHPLPDQPIRPRRHAVINLLCVIFLVWALTSRSEDSQFNSLLKRGDAEEAQLNTHAALVTFQEAEKIEPNNPSVLVRISKEYSDLMREAKTAEAAEKLGQNALSYAKHAVELDPGSAKAHLCLAICYGKLTDYVDSRTKLEYSKFIRDETLRSIELDPTDDYAYHVLGRWNYGIANLNPILRLLAKTVYGGLPAASNEDAAKYLKRAAELAPKRIIHHNELAKVYVALGKTELARKEWEIIVQLPPVDKEDEQARRTARDALKH